MSPQAEELLEKLHDAIRAYGRKEDFAGHAVIGAEADQLQLVDAEIEAFVNKLEKEAEKFRNVCEDWKRDHDLRVGAIQEWKYRAEQAEALLSLVKPNDCAACGKAKAVALSYHCTGCEHPPE